MKKLYTYLVVMLCSVQVFGQVDTVSGYLFRQNNDTVKNYAIIVRPDSTSTTMHPLNQPIFTSTDGRGFYMFELPDTLTPYRVVMEVLDCNSVPVKDTITYTGNSIFHTFPRICNIVGPDTPRGYVYLGTNTKRPLAGNARVYMIQKCTGTADTVSYIDSTLTDTNGFYSFGYYPQLASNCSLITKARLLPQSQDYSRYIPAYHFSQNAHAFRWHNALNITKQYAANGLIIQLPEAINPHGGPSLISGTAMYKNTTTPIPGRLMFIADMQAVPVAYTYTNNNGFFSFSNLQFGTYQVFGDAWDVDNPVLIVTVDADHVYVTNILFTEDNIEYKGQFTSGVTNTTNGLQQLNVYPNPVNDRLYLKGINALNETAYAEMKTVTGATVWQGEVKEHGISTAALPKGIYLLEVSTGSGSKTFRVVK